MCIRDRHIASKKYMSVLPSSILMVKSTISKILLTVISLVALKVLQAGAIALASRKFELTKSECLFQMNMQFFQLVDSANEDFGDVLQSLQLIHKMNATLNVFVVIAFLQMLGSTLKQPFKEEKPDFD